jgi:site-specific DNA-methyltransferase (adenine-specific)
MFGDKQGAYDDNGQRYAVELDKRTGNVGNNHPTVKPVELMKYLIKLVTPPGGTVLDPFNGSGSTGMAAVELGHPYIGCELDPAYVEIAEKRIAAWINRDQPKPVANNFEDLFSATE